MRIRNDRQNTSKPELTLIRAGQHLWAIYKIECGRTPQTRQEQALYAALEDVWRCKRELRAEMRATRRTRFENGSFAVNPAYLNQRSSVSICSQETYAAS